MIFIVSYLETYYVGNQYLYSILIQLAHIGFVQYIVELNAILL